MSWHNALGKKLYCLASDVGKFITETEHISLDHPLKLVQRTSY